MKVNGSDPVSPQPALQPIEIGDGKFIYVDMPLGMPIRLEIASRILAASVRHVVPSGAECDYADVCNESLKVADALIAAHNATDTGELSTNHAPPGEKVK